MQDNLLGIAGVETDWCYFYNQQMKRARILLAHLNSNGDCLYATVIARQIKEVDHPGCHLTWAVNQRSKQTILHNPHVDEIWEYPTQLSLTSPREWRAFSREAEARKNAGEFDRIYYTQIIEKNIINLNGDIRSSTYKNYPHPIKVPYDPIIQLSNEEVSRVKDFTERNMLDSFKNVVLLECGPESFSLSLNPQSALLFAEKYAANNPGTAFILSSATKLESTNPAVIDASTLTFRENAELTKYCNFFIGCSSGISWLATTNWARPLPRIIVFNENGLFNTSMVDDHNYCGLPTDHIIEISEGPGMMQKLEQCFEMAMKESFKTAKDKFHTRFNRKNFKYLYRVADSSFDQWNFTAPFKAFIQAVNRYGLKWNAVYNILKAYIKLPYYIPRNFIRLLRRGSR